MTALAMAACAATAEASSADNRAGPPPASVAPPGLDGEALVQERCTVCHDLGGLTAFQDYWDEDDWRSMIDTMISYGAFLTRDEYEIVARYLGVEYGTEGDEP